jgi:hypothetical protein
MPSVKGKATTIPIVGFEKVVSIGPAERIWESDGILHVRERENRNVFVGTCGGDPCSFGVPFIANRNQNLATGDGVVFGSFAYVVDGTKFTWGSRIGSFEGRWEGKIDGATGVITIWFVAQGSADFEGMQLKGTGMVPPPAVLTEHPIEAFILDPHG